MPKQIVKEIEARFRANTTAYRQEIAQAGKITADLRAKIAQASETLGKAGSASGKQAGAITRSLSGAEKAAERISKAAQNLVGKERELSRATEEQKKRLADLRGKYQRISEDVERLSGVYDTIKEATKGLDLTTPLAKQREQVSAEMDRLETEIRTLQAGIAEAGKGGLVSVGDGFIGMDEAKAKLQELIAAADQAGERFQQLDAAAQAIGEENLGYASSAGLKQLQAEIAASQGKLSQLEGSAGQTESRLASYAERLEDVRRGQEELGESTERLSEQVTELNNAAAEYAELSRLEQEAAAAAAAENALEESTEDLTESVSELGETVSASPLTRLGETLSSVGHSISTGITDKLREASRGFLQMGSSARSGGNGVLSSAMTMAKAMIGVRSLYMLIRRLKSAFSSGMKELSGYSSEVKTSLGSMSAAMSQMQNSIATAFSPLVTTAAPYITSFIGHIADAFNAVGAFFAALTGQNSYTRAVYNYKGVSDAASDAASSTHDAANAQKELNRQLMGFDQINKLSDSSSSGGSGGGGGGGSSGSAGNGLSFVTEGIPGALSGWADKFREAWENADFTDIGGVIGAKLRDALDSIPWDTVKDGARRAAKSVATLLNGFLETEGLSTSIGNTVAEAFNTGFEAVNTFLENFHFDSYGRFISSGIQAALERFEWSQIGRLLSNLVVSGLDFGQGFLDGVNWSKLGDQIWTATKDVVQNIRFKEIAEKFFQLFGTAIDDSRSLIGGYFGSIAGDVTKWATDDAGKVDYKKIWKAVIDGLIAEIDLTRPVREFANKFPELVPDAIRDAFKTVNLADEILSSLAVLKENKSWEEFKTNVGNGFKYAFEHATELAQAIVDGFKVYLAELKLDLNPFDGDGIGIDENISLTAAITGEIVKVMDKTNGTGVVDGVTGNASKLVDKTMGGGVINDATAVASRLRDGTGGGGVINNVTANAPSVKVANKTVDGMTANATKVSVANKDVNISAKTQKVGWTDDATKSMGVSALTEAVKWVKNGADKNLSVNAKAKSISVQNKLVSGIKATISEITLHGKAKTVYDKLFKKAKGGVYQNGRWSNIPQYAGGTTNAGSVFVAGEAGPEIVGHVGGRTEVLNKSQLASTMYSAVVAAVGQYKDYFSRMASSIAQIPRAVSQVSVQRESVPVVAANGVTAAPSASSASFMESIASHLSKYASNSSAIDRPVVVQVTLDGRVVAESTIRQLQSMVREGRDPLAGVV